MKYHRILALSPADHHQTSTWRPWSLRPLSLFAFPVLFLLLCIALELIVLGCDGGCDVFGALSAAEHSRRTTFAYNLLPTIGTVALSLLWALPHHNVMRLEPYFQMSTPGGAKAVDSIFLKYPYIFAMFVPYQAWKHRHYVVFLSSCVALLINFLITPLISGMFNDRQLSVHIPGKGIRATLNRESGIQEPSSVDFAYVAYDYTWLGGTLPEFTTTEYAVLPVHLEGGTSVENETWEAETTLFEAELKCESAEVNINWDEGVHGARLDIRSRMDGGPRVQLCDLLFQVKEGNGTQRCDGWSALVTPWTSISHEFKDPANSKPTYMYAWVSGPDLAWKNTSGAYPPANVTALYCTAGYFSQTVIANFTMPGGRINSVNRTGSRTAFDLLDLAGIISGGRNLFGANQYAGSLPGFGSQPAQVPNVDSQLQRRLGKRPQYLNQYFMTLNGIDNGTLASQSIVYMDNPQALPGYALSGRIPENLGRFLDPVKLASTYESVLKLWFALAVAVDMVDNSPGAALPSVTVTRHVLSRGYVVDPLWARGAQSGLAVAVVISLVLAVWIGQRHCKLDGEPNSLAEALRLLAASSELCAKMEKTEFCSPKEMLKVFDDRRGRYILDLVEGNGPRILLIGVDNSDLSEVTGTCKGDLKPWMKQLLPTRAVFGLSCILAFAVVFALLIAAFVHCSAWGGLPTFAPAHSFRYKILFTFIPVTLGMAAEPLLVTIATCQCMLAPYIALQAGPTPIQDSLTVDYDKSPPHFQLLTSLRMGKFALAALTVTILLSNVLAVALAGLFSATTEKVDYTTQVPAYDLPMFDGTFNVPADEMYFVLNGVLSGLTLPDWTTPEYFILPVTPTPGPKALHEYQVSTLGIGVDIECETVQAKLIALDCLDPVADINCRPPGADFSLRNSVTVDNSCWSKNSSELYTTWNGPSRDILIRSDRCTDIFFAMWMEQPGNPHPQMNQSRQRMDIYEDYLEAVILKCTVVDKVVSLTATVNAQGQVLSTTDIRSLDSQEMTELYRNRTASLASGFFDVITTGVCTNVTAVKENIQWLNHLIATIEPKTIRAVTNLTRIPDVAYIINAFDDIYRRLFAINMRLYVDDIITILDRKQKTHTVPGKAIVIMDRVNMSTQMFYIAASIILILILVLVGIYWKPRAPLGHVPQSLGEMYAALYASNAKEECGKIRGVNSRERARRLEELGGEYRYGVFDTEGGRHYGVSRDGKRLIDTD